MTLRSVRVQTGITSIIRGTISSHITHSTAIINSNLLLQPEFLPQNLLLHTIRSPSNLIKPKIEVVSQIGTGFTPWLVFEGVEVVVEDLGAV